MLFHLGNIDEVQKLLTDHDVNGVNNNGDTPLIIAVEKGKALVISRTFETRTKIN